MARILVKFNQLYVVFSLFIFDILAHAVESPLCGALDGTLPATGDDHKIYFKDDDQAVRTVEMNGQIIGCYSNLLENRGNTWERSFSASVKKCAYEYETFCLNYYEGYPLKYMEYLLKKHSNMLNYYAFASDNLHVTSEPTESDLCASHSKVIYPTTAMTADGTELHIFNTPKHKQGVMISVCVNKDTSCHHSENFTHRTRCEQRYVYRELLALSPEGVPIKEKFKFPSFCSCQRIRN